MSAEDGDHIQAERPVTPPAELDLLGLLRSVGRQWLVLLLMLAGTAGVSYAVARTLPPQYQAVGTVVILPPGDAARNINPYDHFSSAYHILAKVVVASVTADDAVSQLKARGFSAHYDVVTDPETPTITVTATDTNPANAEATMNGIIAEVSSFLTGRQLASGTDSSTWVMIAPVSVPKAPVQTAATLKIGIIVAVLGIIASLSVAIVADTIGLARRRRLEKSRRPARLEWRAAVPGRRASRIPSPSDDNGGLAVGER